MPFIYDVRAPSDTFSALTKTMSGWLNLPATRAALHVGERRWTQMDGGQPGNPVSDALWRDQIDDTADETLRLLLENYRTLFCARRRRRIAPRPAGFCAPVSRATHPRTPPHAPHAARRARRHALRCWPCAQTRATLTAALATSWASHARSPL